MNRTLSHLHLGSGFQDIQILKSLSKELGSFDLFLMPRSELTPCLRKTRGNIELIEMW